MTGFRTEIIDGFIVVRKPDGTIVCDAKPLPGNRLTDVRFADPSYQKCNRTRQAAMKAYQRAGYK